MAASASSSQVPCGKYDVFISFRGPDVRFGFLSHLEEKLRRKGIDVYVDDRLERGEEISSSLVKAIEGSMIALVIFSKDYSSSRWCLEELVKIMECKEAGRQIVIPVFYLVDPSDVRHQKRTYAEAFTLHEEKFKDKVEIWRSVLKKSANLSGFDSSKFQNELKLIDAIVEHVLKKVEENTPIVPKRQLIGSHENLTSVETLMEIESLEVRIVGIWGMGGIGKTTLARAIFDKFLPEFESHYFLENVREKSTKVDGLSSLREELFRELLGRKDNINMNHAMRLLERKKVLIVLDDVSNSKQLKDLAGQQCLHLGLGSRVIVTSRDKHVLRSGGIHDQFIHGVNELSLEESLELFSIHAFNQSHPKMGYQELSEKTVAIVKGIPLALEVLGSHFRFRDKAYWESELSEPKRCPHEQIQNIMKISYDGLDPMDKEIFLDIAFFFKGGNKDIVTCALEACGFKAVSGIQNLMDKALIKFDRYGCIVMHDLIREMAEQIVRGESMRHPERRSRLKDADEIYDVLKSNMGTDEIEGIILDADQIKHLQVRADTFVKMRYLRFLKIFSSTLGRSHNRTYIDLSDLDSFPNKLRYLHWDHYPLETLPSGFYLENLVDLRMINSNVKRLWDGKQDLGNLKRINLSESEQLIELPDFSMARKLEIVDLHRCKSLRSVHPSILSLPSISGMNITYCSKLESLEIETHLESLSYLSAHFCCLKKLCLPSSKLSHIEIHQTNIEMLHFPIGRFTELRSIRIYAGMVGSLSIDELCCFTNLELFFITNVKQVIGLKQLHSLFYAWRNLRELSLDGWSCLSEIPDSIMALTRLEYLSLERSTVETLPTCVSHLSSLKGIYLKRCKRLKSILGLPPFLKTLDAAECTLLETVSSDSLVRNQCSFNFCNCEKLDERSLRYIQELTLSSMTAACEYDDYEVITCYPGSRVPEWMEYKPMTEAVNATEFTCNLERSQDLLICCVATHLGVAPHLASKQLDEVHFYFSYDDNNEFHCYHSVEYPALNQDHVLLWPVRRRSYVAGIGNDAQISCKFFLAYMDCEDEEDEAYCKVPAKACGIHLIYHSEPGQKRERVADIWVEDGIPPTKQLKNSGVSQRSPMELVTNNLKNLMI